MSMTHIEGGGTFLVALCFGGLMRLAKIQIYLLVLAEQLLGEGFLISMRG